jgi:hypothetical protein
MCERGVRDASQETDNSSEVMQVFEDAGAGEERAENPVVEEITSAHGQNQLLPKQLKNAV